MEDPLTCFIPISTRVEKAVAQETVVESLRTVEGTGEELSLVLHDEDKSLPEKIKRKLKTPAQLQGLEEFYTEHTYPTESLKAEIVEKLGLTYKQVSGWFCHRRLKDKRILKSEIEALAPGKQDLSSGVIQDHGSALKQDSCSSNKQGDFRVADLREVESGKLSRDELHDVELNYEQKRVNEGTERDDTPSESDSGLQERFHPKNRNPVIVKTSEYQAANEFITKRRPSGYLKIKGQLENSAITAVKRQLGRHYLEDGPPLGIDFDPLPPGAFELLSKDVFNEAADYRSFHRADEDSISYCQPKQRPSFSNQTRAFPPGHKSSFGFETFSPRETSEYDDGSRNIHHRHDRPGRGTGGTEEPWSSSYDNLNPKVVRRKEHSDFRPLVRHKGSVNTEDRLPSSRIVEDEELYMERRPMTELHDSVRLKSRSTNEQRAGKRGREELFQGDYAMTAATQEHPQWSTPKVLPRYTSRMEMPSSFSEDDTSTSEED